MKYGIFILAFIFAIAFQNRLGSWEMNKAWSVFSGLCIGAMITTGWVNTWKNATPKFVYNDGWTTIDPGRVPIYVGNYAVILSTVSAMGMYWPPSGYYKSPVWITSIDVLRPRGRNLVANVRMEQVTIEQLPLQVRGFIIEKGLKPPYYFGMADVDMYEETIDDPEKVSGLVKPSVSHMLQTIKELHQMVAMLQLIIKNAYDARELSTASVMKIIERMKPSTVTDQIKDLLVEREREQK